ncbi:hypothetical protein C8J57DRAFT_1508729 [Mycena rebaudengoi]|nr:hypothetical protein C8J57DRAFT_1508729 [Mycena rebaudengoi]
MHVFLLEPVTLPVHLPHLIEAGLIGSQEKHPFSPLISQADLQLFSQNEDFIQLFREALARSGSGAAIRRAVDDLFSLAFETDADTLANSAYLVEAKVHVVKYDQRQVPYGPTSIATADGAVSHCSLPREYIQAFIEYKGGRVNNGRQAILDSAAMQAINRSLGLVGIKNYAFSVRHSKVDIITSWWEEAGTEGYQYRFNRQDNEFTLDTPIGWFRFYSFLCRLRA